MQVKYESRWIIKNKESSITIYQRKHDFCLFSEELLAILCLDQPPDYEETVYKTYLSLLLSVFHTACRNLTELRHLVCDWLLKFKSHT